MNLRSVFNDFKWFLKYWLRSTSKSVIDDTKKRVLSPYTFMGIGLLIMLVPWIPYRIYVGISIFVASAFYSEYRKPEWKQWRIEQYRRKAIEREKEATAK